MAEYPCHTAPDPLPLNMAGGASGQLQGGRHIKLAPHTPASNLLLAMINKLGVPAKSHGDSTDYSRSQDDCESPRGIDSVG